VADPFHYPPNVFELLVETIARLSRAKKGVVTFLRGAGVAEDDLAEVERTVAANPNSISKFEIVRRVLTKVNARGDSGLRPCREIIKRVVEFEHFETCWPEDQLKAKGLVASVREAVNEKDAFTRMKQERDAAMEASVARQRAEQVLAADRRRNIERVSARLSTLFNMDNEPQKRGRLLEGVLNDLFRVYTIHVREDFRRKDPDTSIVVEQIDGVVELDGTLHLVEMKWLSSPVGMAEFAPHLVRLFGRANANGIFVSTNGYTDAVIKECTNALNQKTMILCSLREIVLMLRQQDDLISLLRRKSRAAILDKNPFLQIL
jgi:hypothetical protein